MRPEWVPVSAAALVTGVMALVLAQMINPGGSESSPAGQMLVAAEFPGRWLTMSILFFGAAAALVLGMPAVMVLFQDKRGRGIGMVGVAVFTVGCVGVGALAGLMLIFRALALETLKAETVAAGEITLVTESLKNTGLTVTLGVWVYGFMLGVLLIAIGLFRGRKTPTWVPALMVGFLLVQAVMPFLGDGMAARVGSALGLILLAGGFTGVATTAASPNATGVLKRSIV